MYTSILMSEHPRLSSPSQEIQILNSAFNAYRDRVVATLMHQGATHEEAEDCVHSAYVKLREYAQSHAIQPNTAHTLLYQTALRLRIDNGRKTIRQRNLGTKYPEAVTPRAEQPLLRVPPNRLFGLVYTVLSTLPQPRQEIVYEALILEMPHAELNARYHVPLGTIGVWISRAKDKIRREFEKHGITCSTDLFENDAPTRSSDRAPERVE